MYLIKMQNIRDLLVSVTVAKTIAVTIDVSKADVTIAVTIAVAFAVSIDVTTDLHLCHPCISLPVVLVDFNMVNFKWML
jgi:hypothetical protein